LVKKEEILGIVTHGTDLVGICKELIDLANGRGGPDNITCIVARFGGGLPAPDGSEPLGHQVYPLLDTESTTEPVPVYKPEENAGKTETMSAKKPEHGPKKKWWPF